MSIIQRASGCSLPLATESATLSLIKTASTALPVSSPISLAQQLTNKPPDTGTTLLLLPDSVVRDYYKNVKGAQNNPQAGGYAFNCNTELPDFTAVIGNYKAVVPGKYINYAPLNEGSSTCFGGIQSNSGLGFSIFGDIFLKSQYVVFDSNGPRLGFAPQA